jgi:transposase-like protein
MPMRYPKDFRRAVCARLVAGERVSSLSKELAVSEATLHLWKRQALIDAGRADGVKSFEPDDEQDDPPARTGASNPDVMQLALVTQRHRASPVHFVVADSIAGGLDARFDRTHFSRPSQARSAGLSPSLWGRTSL